MKILEYKISPSFSVKALIQASAGGVLEYYDFTIFLMLAKFLSMVFFEGSNYYKIMATYIILAIGYLSKPLGGIILSHFGDKLGRKPIFLLSITVMAISTFAIGVLPTYATIGIYAPILLLLARLIQGMALGGEVPGAITFIYEHMSKNRKMFGTAILLVGISIGVSLGAILFYIIGRVFTDQEIANYAWRIPFIIGGLFGGITILMRMSMDESPVFKHIKIQNAIFASPISKVFKHYKLEILSALLMTFSYESMSTFLFMMLPPFLMVNFHYEAQGAFKLTSISNVLSVISIACWGFLFLKYAKKTKLLLFCVYLLAGLGSLGFVNALIHSNTVIMYSCMIFMVIVMGFCNIGYKTTIPEMYDPRGRYTGTAIPYTIGNGLAGGFTPLIITWLIHKGGNPMFASYYILLLAIIGMIAVVLVKIATQIRQNKPVDRYRISDDNLDINSFSVETFFDGKADKKELQQYFVQGERIVKFVEKRHKVVEKQKQKESQIEKYNKNKLDKYLEEKDRNNTQH